MDTDEEKLRGIGARAAAWWDKAKITVMGLMILGSVLSTTWVLSGTQSEIAGQINQVAESVKELKTSVSGLATKHEDSTKVNAAQDTRLGSLEEWRENLKPDVLLIKQRLMVLEQNTFGRPFFKERP
jgi:outer membrane murein-binding lipoprotein Lpp